RHLRRAVRLYHHGARVWPIHPAILRQPRQLHTVAAGAEIRQGHGPARVHELLGSTVHAHAEAIGVGVEAAGVDGHLDLTVGGDADQGFIAAGEQGQQGEREGALSTGAHGVLRRLWSYLPRVGAFPNLRLIYSTWRKALSPPHPPGALPRPSPAGRLHS